MKYLNMSVFWLSALCVYAFVAYTVIGLAWKG